MPEFIIITETLKQVHSLDEFRGENKKAIFRLPYYRMLEDGTLVFDFIWKDTDPVKLQEFINQGTIYRLVESIVSGKGTDGDRTAQGKRD